MHQDNLHTIFTNVKFYILAAVFFLFPLFFLPFTQEYFLTNKLYLLSSFSILLLLTSTVQFLLTRRFIWYKKRLDGPVILFAIAIALSTILSSPNKVSAVLNVNFGFLPVITLTVIYFYTSRLAHNQLKKITDVIFLSSAFTAVVAVLFFFNPLRNTDVPYLLRFLKNPAFNTLGSQLDLALYFGLMIVGGLAILVKKRSDVHKPYLAIGAVTVAIVAFLLTLFSLLKAVQSTGINALTFPPFRLSWYASVETLKDPLTALFGVGVDNFSALFTRVKDLAYDQSPLWQINSFGYARSTFLHIFAETGLAGFVAFVFLLFVAGKTLLQSKHNGLETHLPQLTLFLGVILVLLFFPPSFVVFVILFFLLATIGEQTNHEVDFSHFLPFYVGIIVLSFLVIGTASYGLVQAYRAELLYKKALDGLANQNLRNLYDYQRQAILINPYIERYRMSFSQTNLLIANNVAQQAQQQQKDKNKPAQPSDQDRQTITQAIQAAIAEAKAAVSLNPQKAANWENLAVIYRNVLNVAQGADVWTISSYQRAIVLDPQNPIYRLNLGGVYYSLNNFDQATQLFEQAVSLKPDWPNAHYNLAWATYQKKDYQRAASEMQTLISLLDPKKDKTDYDRAKKDLEEFKKQIPKTESTQPSSQSGQLELPSKPAQELEPKIQLPKTASPEAK